MSDQPAIRECAEQEAAAWFARLNQREVALAALEEFRLWRQSPGNRSAYDAVDAQWRAMAALRGQPEVDLAVAGALARGGAARSGRGRLTSLWLGGAAAAGLIAVAFGGYVFLSRGALSTGVGEQRIVQLADGSTVRLDTDSRIVLRFAAGERHVDLDRGQAFFEVRHDPSRPFIVQAGDTTVRAVGTRFDVRRDGDRVRAVLVEGVIQVRAGSAAKVWTLQAGQQITSGAGAPQARDADVQAATGWTSGHIVFEAVPLAAAVAEVNRYSRRKVVLDDPSFAAVPVTGVFDSGDVDAFVSAVCLLHPLKAEPDGESRVRLIPGGPSPPRSE
jgi:transmembrane sensor